MRETATKGTAAAVGGRRQGATEVTWNVDPQAAGRSGLTVQQVAGQMAGAEQGDVATELLR